MRCKIINGKQCAVLWYVDDLKITHRDETVLRDVVAKLNARFCQETPLAETWGSVHEYLEASKQSREQQQQQPCLKACPSEKKKFEEPFVAMRNEIRDNPCHSAPSGSMPRDGGIAWLSRLLWLSCDVHFQAKREKSRGLAVATVFRMATCNFLFLREGHVS